MVYVTLRGIEEIFKSWAPYEIAWKHDNVGLQIGSYNQKIRSILVTLDVTDEVIEEARKKNIDLIVSHHPLLFHPLKNIVVDERRGRMVKELIQNNISLYSAHTNLDFTKNGVSITLAQKLKLKEVDFLLKDQHVQKKIVVFVPPTHSERVMLAMSREGAGVIGQYESCSFQTPGYGTFKPSAAANPFIGRTGNLEKVEEYRLEMVVPVWKLKDVITVMKAVHPYEEVAYDVYDLSNPSNDYGAGAIGNLKDRLPLKKFLAYVKHQLRIPVLRYSCDEISSVHRVAVCGGGGVDLLQTAREQEAHVFITGDIPYHRFTDGDNKMVIIDAGHFETEYPAIEKVAQVLREEIRKQNWKTKVSTSKIFRNTIYYLKS
ncbi:MAG: Nif3-like dinuclear metal center hexameric protein [Bacteroidota bacterium]|nr:Nif3-like dinuclear metal center hexameric protein [Bacteroidota bacterium]